MQNNDSIHLNQNTDQIGYINDHNLEKITRDDLNEIHSDQNHQYNYKFLNNMKTIFWLGSLLAILIWGTSFLLVSISNFGNISAINNDAMEEYIKKHAPPLVSDDNSKVFPHLKPYGLSNKLPLNFSVVRDGLFRPSYKSLQWIKEPQSIINDKGTYVIKDKTNYVIKSIVDESYEYTLYNNNSFKFAGQIYEIENLVASPNLKKAIIKTNSTKNWRHSSFALYWILDVSKNEIVPLYNTRDKIAVTSWSPNSSHVAFIFENNVYIKNIGDDSIHQVTFDGSSEIFYGKPDWVYEEEVFGGDLALWWSPDGNKITFLKTNDTLVPEFSIPYYVQENNQDYPLFTNIKYPKAGYSNPIVDLIIFDLNSVSSKDNSISITDFKSNEIKDKLITEVIWVSNDNVLVKTSNRASDLLEIYLISANDNKSTLIRSHSANNSWFEITSNTLYVPKNASLGRENDGYIDTIVVDGFNHLAYFSPPTNPEGLLLTKGQWEVIDGVSSFDFINNEIFFVSTLKSSIERHIHSVNLFDAINSKTLPTVKNITNTAREGWYSGTFSSGSRYLLLNNQGPNVPSQTLIDLHSLATLKTIETNENLINNLEDYDIPQTRYHTITLGKDSETGEDIKANAVETLPLNFNSDLKYPVLFFVYGGPGSQVVTKEFAISFSAVVAAELNAIVVTVDGRGTGYNNHNEKLGSNFKFIVRDKLGHYEPLDQIAAAKIWTEKSYVDSDRIAIWGWSYGGFLTLKTLETDSIDHVFKFGVSIAPVTKWKLYDSIYTERYLREPQENPTGYETASIHDLSNFENVNRFLIMHGSGDDNVHFQNSLKLLDEFNLAGVENFDFMVFPDSDHSIRYHNGNTVVYDRILSWLRKAFNNEFH